MSAQEREWQPGDEADVRLQVKQVKQDAVIGRFVTDDPDAGWVAVPLDCVRPVSGGGEVEAATDDVIERVARVLDPDSFDFPEECASEIEVARALAHDLATAGLLVGGAPGRSEAEIKAEALREHRLEWAGWIADHGAYVGTAEMTQAEIVEALRSDVVPFGWVAGTTEAGDDRG